MAEDPVQALHAALRGLASGQDASRVLHDTLTGAIAATRAREGLVLRAGEGGTRPLAATGPVSRVVLEAAEAEIEGRRLVRRSAPDGRAAAVAHPLKLGTLVIGAIALGGDAHKLDPAALPVFADCAALALTRMPSPALGSLPSFLDALGGLATDVDRASVLVRLFDVAGVLFGATGGLCALVEGEGFRVPYCRGIDPEQLHDVARLPDFKALLTAPGLRVDPMTHPIVAALGASGAGAAVGVPLEAGPRRVGHLLLFLPEHPRGEVAPLLVAFGRHAGLVLRSSELYGRAADREEQLASVVHSMANPVVVVDEAARLLMVNGAAIELFELSGAFDVGTPAAGRLGNDTIEALLGNGDEGDAEVAIGRPMPRIYHASVRRVRAADGTVHGRVLVLDDITREREMEQIKSDFVSVIGHELRTPLTVIKGFVKNLVRKGETVDQATRDLALSSIDANATRLQRLVEDLLFVSAVETRSVSHLEDSDLGEAADAAGTGFGDRVIVRRPRSGLRFQFDRGKVDQVLQHLLDNALKYSKGQVEIEIADRGEDLEVSVVDHGEGIFSGDIHLLFERFRQLDGSSTRSHGGTGLGLYVCRRLVEAQGGRIWCESRLGQGSRFTFTVPRVTEERQTVVVP